MKTILFGKVTGQHLADAALFAGIEPTAFVTNRKAPATVHGLPVEVILPCPKVPGEAGEQQCHARMVLVADALICAEPNEHLVGWAQKYDLPIYEVDQ